MDHDSATAGRLAKSKSRRTAKMSLDNGTGRYCAKLGRKQLRSGGYDGHKFRFTPDLKESERRKIRIQELWDRLIIQHGPGRLWTDEDLLVAQRLADGKSKAEFSVEQLAPMSEVRRQLLRFRSRPRLYAMEIARLQEAYPDCRRCRRPRSLGKGQAGTGRRFWAGRGLRTESCSSGQRTSRPFHGRPNRGRGSRRLRGVHQDGASD